MQKTMNQDEYHNLIREVVEIREERKKLDRDRKEIDAKRERLREQEEQDEEYKGGRNKTTSD